jgi:hypothetical protein
MLTMFHPRQEFSLGGTATSQLVRDDYAGDVLAPLQQLPEESPRGFLVPAALHQNIEEMSVLIHRALEIMALTLSGEKYFIQVPRVGRPGTAAPELMGILLPALAAPLPGRFIGHDDPTDEQEFFHVAVAEAEPEMEPDRAADDLTWDAVVLIAVVGWCVHALSMAHQAGAGQAPPQVDDAVCRRQAPALINYICATGQIQPS